MRKALLCCAIISVFGVLALARSPAGSSAGLDPERWEIAIGWVDTPDADQHGVKIVETRGFSVGRVMNAGPKGVVGLKFGWKVRDLDNPSTVFETNETSWVEVKRIQPGKHIRVNTKLTDPDELIDQAAKNEYSSRHLDVSVAVIGVRFNDGSAWEASDAVIDAY